MKKFISIALCVILLGCSAVAQLLFIKAVGIHDGEHDYGNKDRACYKGLHRYGKQNGKQACKTRCKEHLACKAMRSKPVLLVGKCPGDLNANGAVARDLGHIVAHNHKQHTKTGTGSVLEKIPGIGETRRKALLKSFGSVKAIKGADLQELEKVLPKNAAQSVYNYFRTKEE